MLLKWLVLLHVLTAIIGLGPTYAFPFLLRKTASRDEMVRALQTVARLELFPKWFGTAAVLSGLALFVLGQYGPWLQVWIIGTLLLYIVIEVLVVALLNPAAKRLLDSLSEPQEASAQPLLHQAEGMYARVRSLHLWASALALLIFVLMIMKP